MIYDFSSHSEFLSAVLKDRQEANKAYSLRAMAKSVGLSPTTLSDVIKGKKKLSAETAKKVAERLKLPSRKAKYFITLVQYEIAKDTNLKQFLSGQLKALNPQLQQHFDVNVDQFRFMADWYHTTILEMTYLKNQKMDAESIAASLDIEVSQATEALERLKKLELIEWMDGRYQKTQKTFKIQSSGPNLALRKYHHQMLNKAQESLNTQTAQEKLVGSETIPLNIEDLSAANDIIETCFQQILDLSRASQNKTHVYHLGIQFFQTTKDLKKKAGL